MRQAAKSAILIPPRKIRPELLTSRETEILELIWVGFKNKEISQRLKISVKTVEAHRANMMRKIRVANTAQLPRTAIYDRTIDSTQSGLDRKRICSPFNASCLSL